jgi:hypothetical protein
MSYVETVRDREGVKHGADVFQTEDGGTVVRIDFNSVIRNLDGPEE